MHDEEWLKEKEAFRKYVEEIKRQNEKRFDYTVVRKEYRYDKELHVINILFLK